MSTDIDIFELESKQLAILRRHCVVFCEIVRDDLDRHYSEKEKQTQLIAAASVRSARHICECLSSADILISTGFCSAPCTLLRPAYESAIRLLWSSGEENGWNRMAYYWCTEDIKAVKGYLATTGDPGHLKEYLNDRKAMQAEAQKTITAELLKRASFMQILKECHKQIGIDGESPLCPRDFAWHYSLIYRSLSMQTHGHWVGGCPQDQRTVIYVGALAGAFAVQFLAIVALRLGVVGVPARHEYYKELLIQQWEAMDKLADRA